MLHTNALFAGAVFVISVGITLLFWMVLPGELQINENSDYTSFYEPVARNISKGHGFTDNDATPAVRYPPGYPILLAGIFQLSRLLNIADDTALPAFTLISMGLTSVLLFMLARSLWAPWPAFVSSLVWMAYPFSLWLTKQPNSEIPFLVIFYGGFCLFWYALRHRSRTWPVYFLTGLSMGLAMLVRPIAIGMGFLLGGILFVLRSDMSGRRRVTLAAVILLGNLVAIIPWEVWMYARTGKVIPLSTAGEPGVYQGLTFAYDIGAPGYPQIIEVPENVSLLMQEILSNNVRRLQETGTFLAEKVRTEPLTLMTLFGLKAARSWYGTYTGRFEMTITLIQALYLVVILWSSRAAWKLGGSAKELTITVWLVTAYFWAMTTLVLSILRYMVPAIGLLFVLVPAAFLIDRTTKTNAGNAT